MMQENKAREFLLKKKIKPVVHMEFDVFEALPARETSPKILRLECAIGHIRVIEKSHYDKAVGFIKDEKCSCRSVQDQQTGERDLDMCGRCQALVELGEKT